MSAGGSVIGALRVVLGADTADFDKGLKSSQSGLASFGKQVAAIAGGISLEKGLDRAITALFGAVRSGIDEADKLNKLSQSIGIPVDELSKLKYAGDLADVSLESLGKSTVKLSKAMTEVAGGGTGPAKQAFDALGISVKNADGTMKSANDVLGEAADKFAGYKDGAAKTALAVALFGKAGAEMIPLLNMGRDGLKEAGDEAERFGLVLDKNTTQAAENYNDNLTKLHKTKDGIIIQITARLLPAMEDFSNKMVQAAKDGELLDKVASGIEYILRGTASIVLQVSVAFQRLFAEIGAFVTAYQGADGVFSGLKAGWAAMNAEGEKTQQVMAGLKSSVANIWAGAPDFSWDTQANSIARLNKEVNLLGAEWGKSAAPIIASENASKNAIESFLGSVAKRNAGLLAEAGTVGKSIGEHERLKVQLEAEAIAKEKNIPITEALRQRIAAMGDAAAAARMKIAGAQVAQEVMDPAEQFAQKMEQQRLLYEAGAISLDVYGKKQQQIAEQAGATWDIAGASIAGSFAQISGAFGKESSSMATAAKVFGIIQGTISMFTGAAKALELPFPANIAAVAAVLAKGASLVASIKSQSIPTGYMTGGSFTVGGSGGPDSTPVSFMASPGEQVDVWRPDQGGGSDPRGGRSGGNVVNLSMPIATTRDALRDLIEGLNGMFQDGYQLKIQAA